jgi:hypothetical protein
MTKKNNKLVSEQIRTVSGDGNTLMVEMTYHPRDSDQTVTSEATAIRIGDGSCWLKWDFWLVATRQD